jgi:hypothetical protein
VVATANQVIPLKFSLAGRLPQLPCCEPFQYCAVNLAEPSVFYLRHVTSSERKDLSHPIHRRHLTTPTPIVTVFRFTSAAVREVMLCVPQFGLTREGFR